MTVSVVVWGDAGTLVEDLERLRGAVTVVRQCDDLAEVSALAESGLADAALLAGPPNGVDAAFADALLARGVACVALTADAGERARLAALGVATDSPDADAQAVSDLLELAAGAGRPRPAAPPRTAGAAGGDGAAPGRVVAVWGPAGAPGRTTVAVNLAAEAALAGRRTVLVDADTYGASVAVHLGLLDESAGLAHLCRLSDQGILDGAAFERACPPVAVAGARIRVATGLPRPHRWPEVRGEALARVLAFARTRADLVVVDAATPLETDEDLTFDTAAPQRNAATLAALRTADEVLAVGAADSVGVPRLVRAVEELADAVPGAAVRVVLNKVRASAVGASPRRQLRESWQRFGPGPALDAFLPWEPAAADAALLAGSALAESAPGSPLRSAIAALAGHRVERRRARWRGLRAADVTRP